MFRTIDDHGSEVSLKGRGTRILRLNLSLRERKVGDFNPSEESPHEGGPAGTVLKVGGVVLVHIFVLGSTVKHVGGIPFSLPGVPD